MKVIEGLKGIKDLSRKADDLQDKISKHSAHLNVETPVYTDQKKQVREWLQAHSDVLKEMLRLRIAIQRTNLAVEVEIELGGKKVKKTIAEWIHRRRDLAGKEMNVWKVLTDKGLKEGFIKESSGEQREIKIIRCYEPEARDVMVELYISEPMIIDSRLEVINAVSDLIE